MDRPRLICRSVSCTFFPPHLQEVVETIKKTPVSFLRCSLVRILLASSSKSGPNPLHRALATVSCQCAFCRRHLPKMVRTRSFLQFVRTCQFCFCVMLHRALAQSRAHFVVHFPDRGAKPWKHRPSSGDRGQPLYSKKRMVLRRECFQPWIHAFPIARISQLLHDDVVDMMICFSWWCGWHAGATAGCENRS